MRTSITTTRARARGATESLKLSSFRNQLRHDLLKIKASLDGMGLTITNHLAWFFGEATSLSTTRPTTVLLDGTSITLAMLSGDSTSLMSRMSQLERKIEHYHHDKDSL